MKYSKEYCNYLATLVEGIQFVCWEYNDNSYIFQSGDYQNGFFEYRLLEPDMTPYNASLMFTKGITNNNTPASIKAQIKEAKMDHKACIAEGLLNEEEIQESLQEIEELKDFYSNLVKYRV